MKNLKRAKRVRAKIQGTEARPRLSVFRSNTKIYAQLINDIKGQTIAQVFDKKQKAQDVGKQIAQKAIQQKITEVVFDRGCYKFHGRVKVLAEGARNEGLKF